MMISMAIKSESIRSLDSCLPCHRLITIASQDTGRLRESLDCWLAHCVLEGR